MRHYALRCPSCGRTIDDDGFILDCSDQHEPVLLEADYEDRSFRPDLDAPGLFRYWRWLPSLRTLAGSGSGVTYRSESLNRRVGLPNLWVAFNGYWPEKGATLETLTFKEFEAWTVLSRIPESRDRVLVVSSAGNTAAAFARACSTRGVPCLIIVPQAGLPSLQLCDALHPCVKIVSLIGSSDYSDAITLANRISRVQGFFPEGGAKNPARRAGLGVPVLNAVETIGEMPRYYFQAVGSGTGGIGAYEAARRLVADGRFGERLPRLMLSQNVPFAPMYTSWQSRRREMVAIDAEEGRRQVQQILTPVLSNRLPPYSIRGGVFDALTETHGDMLVADNIEALEAQRAFEEIEGIDIDPAAAVAFATLLKAAACGQIERDAVVLLNVTGGGRYRRQLDRRTIPIQPALQLDQQELLSDETLERLVGLFH
jgi:cysteate synthase